MTVVSRTPGPVQVWVATLDAADLALRSWLDEGERERLAGYQGEADRARFLLGAALVRAATGSHLGVLPQHVTVDRRCPGCGGGHGRPVVPGSALTLSVTHAGLVVALAAVVEGAVGIDVERVGRRPLDEVRRWTRAEARFKAGGLPGVEVRELDPPAADHVLTLAAEPGRPVHVHPAGRLLAAAAGTAVPG